MCNPGLCVNEPQPQRNRTFICRFLVKPPDDTEETMEEKQQRVSKYESMQICSALLPSNSDRLESGDVSSESSDIGSCLMCVARRIPPNEKPIGSLIEQFAVKLDTTGKIITVDISGLSPLFSKYLNKVRVRKFLVYTISNILYLFYQWQFRCNTRLYQRSSFRKCVFGDTSTGRIIFYSNFRIS